MSANTLTLAEKMPGWITQVHGAAEGQKAVGVPFDILRELYPEIARYGPNFARMRALHTAMHSMLTDNPEPGPSQDAARRKRAHILKTMGNMTIYFIGGVFIPGDHLPFISNTQSYISAMLLLQPGMSPKTGVGNTYSALLISIVMDGILEERYMPEIVANMNQVAVLESLLFNK